MKLFAACVTGLALAACAQNPNLGYDAPAGTKSEYRSDEVNKSGSVFGGGGLSLLGGDKKSNEPTAPIPVNSFLWRATLDTLSFMPLASADPFGGVIITDWYTPPEVTSERFKLTVYILSRQLRADGLRVAVFRQRQNDGGNWVDEEVGTETASELENAILTRARELRVANIAQ
ncbi:MAG: DUF3576 domain-containing protein [Alphaproteobacteria bacterium]